MRFLMPYWSSAAAYADAIIADGWRATSDRTAGLWRYAHRDGPQPPGRCGRQSVQDSVKRLAADSALLERLGADAPRYAASHFGLLVVLDRVELQYHEMIARFPEKVAHV
jgi:hypothetical protein